MTVYKGKGESYFDTMATYFKLALEHLAVAQTTVDKFVYPNSKQPLIDVDVKYTTDENGKRKWDGYKQAPANEWCPTMFKKYNDAVKSVKGFDLKGNKAKIEKIQTDVEAIKQAILDFNAYVEKEGSAKEIANKLNVSAKKLGIKGTFSVSEDGESTEVVYTWKDSKGNTHSMTITELLNATFSTFAVNLGFQAAAGEASAENGENLSVEGQQEASAAADLVTDTAEKTKSYGVTSPEGVKAAIASVAPEIAEELGADATVEQYLQKYGESRVGPDFVLETGGVAATTAWVFSQIAGSDAFDLAGYLDGKDDAFEQALGLPEEEEPVKPTTKKPQETNEEQEEEITTGTPVFDNDDSQSSQEPSVLGDQDGGGSGTGGDTGTDTGAGADTGAGTDTGTGTGYDYGTGTGTGTGTGSSEPRTPISSLITQDDIVDSYIGSSSDTTGIVGGNANAISFDVGTDYDALALEEYNNSSAEIKAAGILAVVSEANNLFDNDTAALSSKLFGMGYNEAEVAEIMKDRDLTIQAFTQNAKEEELAKTAQELAEKDGDSEYQSKYGKKKSVSKLKNGGEDDAETTAAKEKLDDSVDSYKQAVDDANAALDKAKNLKSQLESMTQEYGDDYTKWTDEQYSKYNELANEYNSAVADAKVKVEAVENAKATYETAKTDYNNLFTESEPVSGTGSTPEVTPSEPVVSTQSDASVGVEAPTLESNEPKFESSALKAATVGSESVSNLSEVEVPQATIAETQGTVNVELPQAIDVDNVSIPGEAEIPIVPATGDSSQHSIAVSSGISNVVETASPGLGNGISGELISVGAALALKAANTLINGGKKKVVLNYDELAIYKYEKVDKKVRDNFDNKLIEETNTLFTNNKDELVRRLKEYGYSDIDASKISVNLDLAKEAMLDGGRRSQLAQFAKALAKEDGIENYDSTYSLGRSVYDLENGTSAALREDFSGDAEFEKIREQYFNMEKDFVDFANNANEDLMKLNEAKDNFNKFITEHGSDSGKWSNEEYKNYEDLNNQNIVAKQVFEASNKKFEDIQNVFGEMRADYEKEKAKRTQRRNIDPTNVKQLMEEPANA